MTVHRIGTAAAISCAGSVPHFQTHIHSSHRPKLQAVWRSVSAAVPRLPKSLSSPSAKEA